MSLSLLLVPGHLNIASLCCEALIAPPSILVTVKSQVDWDLTRVRVVQRNGNGGIYRDNIKDFFVAIMRRDYDLFSQLWRMRSPAVCHQQARSPEKLVV